jgi:O-antigen ligase
MFYSKIRLIKSFLNAHEIDILYGVYLAPLMVMFISNDIFIAHDIFSYTTVPLFIYLYSKNHYHGKGLRFSFKILHKKVTHCIFANISLSLIFIASIVYILQLSLMTILLPSFNFGWIKVMFYFTFPLIFFLIITSYLFVYTIWFTDYLYTHLSFAAAITALANIYVYIKNMNDMGRFELVRMKSTYGHVIDHSENASGVLYAVFFVASFILFFRLKSNYFKICMMISTIILFSATIFTQSRSALVASAICLFVFLILADSQYKKFVYGFIFTALAAYFSFKKISGSALERGNSYRFEVWSKYIDIIKKKMIFGYGERTNFAVPISDGEIISHAHNMVLNSLLDGGLIAACSVIFIFYYSLICGSNYNKSCKNPFPFIMILFPLIAGLVDFKLEILTAGWHWIVFWLPVGLCIGAEVSTRMKPVMPDSSIVPILY